MSSFSEQVINGTYGKKKKNEPSFSEQVIGGTYKEPVEKKVKKTPMIQTMAKAKKNYDSLISKAAEEAKANTLPALPLKRDKKELFKEQNAGLAKMVSTAQTNISARDKETAKATKKNKTNEALPLLNQTNKEKSALQDVTAQYGTVKKNKQKEQKRLNSITQNENTMKELEQKIKSPVYNTDKKKEWATEYYLLKQKNEQLKDVSQANLIDTGINLYTSGMSAVEDLAKGTSYLIDAGIAQMYDWAGDKARAEEIRENIARASQGKDKNINKLSIMKNTAEQTKNRSLLGKPGNDISYSLGQLISFGALPEPVMFTSPTGQGYAETLSKGGNNEQAWLRGTGQGAISYGTEHLGGFFGKTNIDDAAANYLSNKFSNKLAKFAIRQGVTGTAEAGEELLEYGGDQLLDLALDKTSSKKSTKFHEKWDWSQVGNDMLMAFLTSELAGAGQIAMNVNNVKTETGQTYSQAFDTYMKSLDTQNDIITDDQKVKAPKEQIAPVINSAINERNEAELEELNENNTINQEEVETPKKQAKNEQIAPIKNTTTTTTTENTTETVEELENVVENLKNLRETTTNRQEQVQLENHIQQLETEIQQLTDNSSTFAQENKIQSDLQQIAESTQNENIQNTPQDNNQQNNQIYSEENVKLRDKAKTELGTTTNLREAGYLTTDGNYLDFSGKKQGASGGQRQMDHREVADIYDDDQYTAAEKKYPNMGSATAVLQDFMDKGNIRLNNTGVEIATAPTSEQYDKLYDYLDYVQKDNGDVFIDLDTETNNRENLEYNSKTSINKMINDIKEHYSKLNNAITATEGMQVANNNNREYNNEKAIPEGTLINEYNDKLSKEEWREYFKKIDNNGIQYQYGDNEKSLINVNGKLLLSTYQNSKPQVVAMWDLNKIATEVYGMNADEIANTIIEVAERTNYDEEKIREIIRNFNEEKLFTRSDNTSSNVTNDIKESRNIYEQTNKDSTNNEEGRGILPSNGSNDSRDVENTSFSNEKESKIQGLENYTQTEIKDITKEYINDLLEEYGYDDINIEDIEIHGSRKRGTAKAKSDLDVVVQYDGDIREDDFFNLLNDNGDDNLYIDGIRVDINPIQEDIKSYMERSSQYDQEILSKQSKEKIAPVKENTKQNKVENIMEEAKKKYGTTDNFEYGAFMTTDGELLDFQNGNQRDEHNDFKINDIDANKFVDMGAIRIAPEANSIQINTEPTAEQYDKLYDLIEYFKDEELDDMIYIDLSNNGKINDFSKSIDTNTNKIINDVKKFWSENSTKSKQVAPTEETTKKIAPVKEKTNLPMVKSNDNVKQIKFTENDYKKIADSINSKPRSWLETSLDSKTLEDYQPELIKGLKDENLTYVVQSNKSTLEKANKKLNSMKYEDAVSYIEGKLYDEKNMTLTDIALTERLIQEASKKGDYQTASDLIQDLAILGTDMGQKVQALSLIKKLTPEGQLSMYQKIVNRAKAKGEVAFEDVEITPEMVKKVLDAYDKNGNYDQKDLDERVEQFKQDIADQLKSTTADKLNSWRYLSMLGNPKTHIRNIVSNVAMKGTIKVKNAMARTLESIAPIKQENRTKTWKKASPEIKQFAKQTAIEMKDTITGENKYNERTQLEQKKQIFKNKLLEKASNFNGSALEFEDWLFSKNAFQNTFQEYLTAQGIRTEQDIQNNPEIIEKGKQYAVEQAEIATFRQYSKLAAKIAEIERHNKGAKLAIEALVPFKKTPINVAKAGVNYSPLGLAKSVFYDSVQLKNGNINGSQFIDSLSQGMTGTGLTLLGYMLAKAGILTGSGDDDKEGKYDNQLGNQNYAINLGGKSYSISWLSPVAMPLLVGSNAYEGLEKQEGWDANIVTDTLASTLDPLSSMSFVSGLTDTLNSYSKGSSNMIKDIGLNTLESYILQYIPTLSSQFASVTDDKKRSTTPSNNSKFKWGEKVGRQIMYKIPGLRQQLEVSTDIWGNEKEQSDNIVERAFETFLAPYSKTEHIATDVDKEIKKIYEETGETGVIPGVPYGYIKSGDETYRMSAKEYTQYKKTYGQTANSTLNKIINSQVYDNASYDEKVKMVENTYKYARETAKQEYFDNNGVDYESTLLDKLNTLKDKYNVNPDKYFENKQEYDYAYRYPDNYNFIKSITSYDQYNVYKDKISDIKKNYTTTSGRLNAVADYVNGLNLSVPQKAMLIKSNYKSFKTYDSNIINYINKQNLSVSEKTAILEKLGFTVRNGRVY